MKMREKNNELRNQLNKLLKSRKTDEITINEIKKIRVEIWDHDTIGKSDFMGAATYDFSEISEVCYDNWKTLEGTTPLLKEEKKVTGEILVNFDFF